MIRTFLRITRIDDFALRMALLYAALFAFNGIQLPYLPVWLEAKELTPREIGIVLAVPMLVRIIAMPFATRLIDRRLIHKPALTVAAALSALGYAVMAFTQGFLAIIATYAVIAVASAPLLPLTDSFALRGLNARKLAYGPVRLWGSITFILANAVGGVFFAMRGAAELVWMLTAAMAATAATTLALPLAPDDTKTAAFGDAGRSLWRSGLFATTVLGASLIQASHAVMYGFATVQWSAKGFGGTAIGLLWAIGVIAEILLFAMSRVAVARIGDVNMILLGGSGALLRWTMMAFDSPTALLPILQCFHGLSFGATHLGAMHVLARIADRGSPAAAQGDFSALQAVTFAAAMGVSGVLVETLGTLAYLAMAAVAAVGLVTAAGGRRIWRGADRA